MSLNIPQNFPDSCTGEEINSTIRDIRDLVLKEPLDIHQVQRYTPLINLGLSELARRANEVIVQRSKVLGNISIGIALVAIGISVLGTMNSTEWEAKHLTVLQRIDVNTAACGRMGRTRAIY